jgi:hypothetical protein
LKLTYLIVIEPTPSFPSPTDLFWFCTPVTCEQGHILSCKNANVSSVTTDTSIWTRSYSWILSTLRSHCPSIWRLYEYGLAFHILETCNSCHHHYPVQLDFGSFSTRQLDESACVFKDGLGREKEYKFIIVKAILFQLYRA